MAKRHIQDYYKQIEEQYLDMINEIHDFEEECERGLVSPERIEAIKEMIKPLKDNYMRWSYVMYLLNLPNNPKKEKTFKRRSKHIKEDTKTPKENSEVLRKLREQNKELGSL